MKRRLVLDKADKINVNNYKSPAKQRVIVKRRGSSIGNLNSWTDIGKGFENFQPSTSKSLKKFSTGNESAGDDGINAIDNFSSDEESLGIQPLDRKASLKTKTISISKKILTPNAKQGERSRLIKPVIHGRVQVNDVKDEVLAIDSSSPVADKKTDKTKPETTSSGTKKDSQHIISSKDPLKIMFDDNSPVISTASSSPTSTLEDGERRTGSVLLQNLQTRKTPEKLDDIVFSAGDSAKKTKKYQRGSLADQLQRLTVRLSSTIAFWKHKISKGECLPDATKVLAVTIIRMQGQWTHVKASCLTENEEQLTVIFQASNAKQLSLKCGSQVRIFPPWHKLVLPSKEAVILCTQLSQVVGIEKKYEKEYNPYPERSPYLMQKSPYTNGRYGEQTSLSTPYNAEASHFSTTLPPCNEPDVRLGFADFLESEDGQVSDRVQRSILESIENGESSATGISFQATIQRLYCRRMAVVSTVTPPLHKLRISRRGYHNQTEVALRWFALLEDVHGGFCELQLPDQCLSFDNGIWHEVIRNGHGKTFIWSGLRVHQRLKKSKYAGLFNLIDSVWDPVLLSDSSVSSSTDSSQMSGEVQTSTSAPGFCYSMLALDDVSSCAEIDDIKATVYKPSEYMTLNELLNSQPRNSPLICSLSGSLFFIKNKSNNQGNDQWYITDHTIYNHPKSCYVLIHLDAQTVINDQLDAELKTPAFVVLRDIIYENGELHTNGYSQIIMNRDDVCLEERGIAISNERKQELVCQLRGLQPSLLHISCETDPMSLAHLTGTIIDINESEAYTWQECDVCGNDQLASNPEICSHVLYCGTCHRSVKAPVDRIHLEVTVKPIDVNAGFLVHISLLQKTIQSILPPEKEDEGYDMNSVLGHQLTQVPCHISRLYRQRMTKELMIYADEINLQVTG